MVLATECENDADPVPVDDEEHNLSGVDDWAHLGVGKG